MFRHVPSYVNLRSGDFETFANRDELLRNNRSTILSDTHTILFFLVLRRQVYLVMRPCPLSRVELENYKGNLGG